MFRAQMSDSGGAWRLYVALMGVSSWPERRWSRAASIPTLADRAQALADLGYEILPDREWEWLEDRVDPFNAGSSVLLIASVDVRRTSTGAYLLPRDEGTA
ncbi:DUF6303 family protein [Streptomyces sp. NPDC058304]|uniref:DUF6303 family protein n=1 Tax=Streptomyces sp. NPDC058304 TaxID=3346437 RepID=UPI0036E3409C